MLYVWQGGNVLRNYASGLVVVAASSPEMAWEKLAKNDLQAFWYLKTGRRIHVYSWMPAANEDAKYAMEEDTKEYGGLQNPEPNFPINPTEFTEDTMPIIVLWGGE